MYEGASARRVPPATKKSAVSDDVDARTALLILATIVEAVEGEDKTTSTQELRFHRSRDEFPGALAQQFRQRIQRFWLSDRD